ncbi:TPA: hypothetical protein DEX28_02835 [Patescibacteria group bacterium]|nr:hypothetical protein [Patescibacteria group bacterium]
MKRLVFLALSVIVFLVACAPATEATTDVVPSNGITPPQVVVPQVVLPGSSSTQSEETNVSPATTKGIEFNWWIFSAWAIVVSAFIFGAFQLVVFIVEKVFHKDWSWGTMGKRVKWLVGVIGFILSLVLATFAQTKDIDSVSLLIGLLCWAWLSSRIAYWILKSIRNKQQKHRVVVLELTREVEQAGERLEKEQEKNLVRQQSASLSKKLQVAREARSAKQDKLEDLSDQRGDQAENLRRAIAEKDREINRLQSQLDGLPAPMPSQIELLLEGELNEEKAKLSKAIDMANETRLSDSVLDLDGDGQVDNRVIDLLEAMMAPWLFSVGRLLKKNRDLIHGIKFPGLLWIVSLLILLGLYSWLGNPFGVVFAVTIVLVVVLWLLGQIPVIGMFFKGLLKSLLAVLGEVVEMEFHAARTVEIMRATTSVASKKL